MKDRTVIDRIAFALFAAACLVSPAIAQGPPPPVRVPEAFQTPVEGYGMITPYQMWRFHIEQEKGPVTEQALAQAEVLDGRQRVGKPVFTAAFNNDFGRYASVDLQVFCTRTPVYPDRDRGECSYLYRQAGVPLGPGYRDPGNAFDDWMVENFDPALVVRNLRAAGIAPGADLWRENGDVLFDGAASPRQMLAEHLQIIRVDSRECPALRNAVEAVERARLDWTLDLFAVGEDEPFRFPGPHAATATYTLNAWVGGQPLTLTGDGALQSLLGPVLRAAHGCESAQRAARS